VLGAPAAGVALPRDPELAASPAGAPGAPPERLVYSGACGRVHMMNVTVQNVGVDWHHPGNCYWRHKVRARAPGGGGRGCWTHAGAGPKKAQGRFKRRRRALNRPPASPPPCFPRP
jgi:hypothetical protein